MKRLLLLIAALGAMGSVADERAGGAMAPPGLQDGDTVLFYGDSITHQGHYVSYVYLFYATRYPRLRIPFYNGGVGGNRTSTALQRFRQDVTAQDPALVAVLLGMNDAGYQEFSPDVLGRYGRGMTTIVERVESETGARVALLTPTYYDHEERVRYLAGEAPDKTSYAEYNGVLERYGRFLAELGKERGYRVVDLNAPMKRVTRELRKEDPDATLSRDGVHPLPEGHFVMACAILEGWGVTGTVSSVHIDAADGLRAAHRCTVREVRTAPDGVSFTLLAESLPCPLPEEIAALARRLSFTERLNRERVRVSGLPEGMYALRIDGDRVATFSAAALAEGVSLADNPKTPQHRQAAALLAPHREWRDLVRRQRMFRWMEKVRGYRKPDGSYASDRNGTYLIDENDWAVEVSEDAWQEKFDELAAGEARRLENIEALEQRIHAAAAPREHRVEVERVK